MRSLYTILMIGGVLSLFGGLLAILNPFAASMAAITLAAITLVASGLIQLVGTFSESGWRQRLPSLALAAATLFLGISVFRNPVAGVAALTILIGILFLASGLSKLVWSFMHSNDSSFWPLLVSGFLSLLLAILVYRQMQVGKMNIIGLFLGVELMLNGIALIAVAALGREVGQRFKL